MCAGCLAQVVEKRGRQYLSDNMPLMHADLHDMPRPEAAKLFIRELSAPPTAHNTHLYKLKRSKHEPLGTAWLGICPRGIEIYEVSTSLGTAWLGIEIYEGSAMGSDETAGL